LSYRRIFNLFFNIQIIIEEK